MTRSVFRLQAPAKLNLTLEVVGRRADGFHDIRSVFLRLDALADRLVIRIEAPSRLARVGITASGGVPTDESNICHQAATAYLKRSGQVATVDIAIEKRIPVAAGMGGGSSDAAAVLLALNRHFRSLTPRDLERMAGDIGKDVPFFLRMRRACSVSGTGDVITPLRIVPTLHVLVVNPHVAVSTREAYQALDATAWYMGQPDRVNRSRAMVRALASHDLGHIAATLFNDFEPSVERAHPVVKEIKQALAAFGAIGTLMTGSGSSVFGLFASRPSRARAQRKLATHYPGFIICPA